MRDIGKKTHTKTHQTSNQLPRFRSLPPGGLKKREKSREKIRKFFKCEKGINGKKKIITKKSKINYNKYLQD
jgi:hypothetical protein